MARARMPQGAKSKIVKAIEEIIDLGDGAAAKKVAKVVDDVKAPARPSHVPTRQEAAQLSRAEREKLRGVDLGDGRDTFGNYTSHDYVSANKEAQGLKQYEKENGLTTSDKQVEVRVDGSDQVRKYDGLAQKPDTTYEGVEVKSGSAGGKYDQPGSKQRAFDESVSYDRPATGKMNGKPISVTSVVVIRVP